MIGAHRARARLERFGQRADSLAAWSALYARVKEPAPPVRGLRFVSYWRCSDGDRQDSVTSRVLQLGRAAPTIAGAGVIVHEVSDIDVPRELP